MSDTSIQARPNSLPVLPAPPPQTRNGFWWYVKKFFKPLASLRLTVFLFVLSMILVFCGTLAMMDQGLFTVLSRYFRSGIAWIPLQLFVRFGQVFFGISPDAHVAGSIPFPGGWLIGVVLLINLLAAHIVRFRFTWKRSGILLIHSGIIVLMLGELVTGLFAVESNMSIPVGGSSNYVENFDKLELAFVSSANDKQNNVVVVPESQLHAGGVIHDELLPVDIEVERYLNNSTLPKEIPPGTENLATHGFGLQTVAIEQPPGRGVDTNQKRDMPAAYVTFKDKKTGQSLGTYLVSLGLEAQEVDIDGTLYRVAYRLKRNYLPFAFHLEKLNHETYRGTSMAKRYASLVRVTGDNGLDREVLIHMNHPFYFEGQTFYQSQVATPSGVEVTGLQVVRNPGWPLPYIACAMVSGGMVVHFLLHLLGFFRRNVPQSAPLTNFEQFGPWAVIGLAVVYLLAMMMPPAESDNRMNLDKFASLPLQDDGRVKPFDTLARNSLMIISNKQTFIDENKKEQPAIRWLLDVMTSGPLFKFSNEEKGTHFPLPAEKHRVFRIDNPEVVTMLGMKRRDGSRYAINEFSDHLGKLETEAEIVARKDPKKLSPYDKGIHDLYRHMQLYMKLGSWPQTMYAVPPSISGGEWQNFREARAGEQENEAVGKFAMMVMAYAKDDVPSFNKEVDDYRKQIGAPITADVRRSGAEAFLNHFEPFYQCTILYVFVFLLGCLSWLGWTRTLNRAAFWLAIVALVVHTVALVGRMYLMDRWFVVVTSLYSSAVFIGWGCVVLGLLLEKLFPNGIGIVVAGFCGAVTMLIAHHLGSDGDTLALLQPVLDTNFWLATHVTCVTMGYTATFVAGFLGVAYILGGVLSPALTRPVSKILGQMLYGILCFAMLLSFTGTVLGGIWADQSWGRFWGWDPKENGALLIVIWNALILHARWGGLVQQRGMAVLAVVGNMVTGWSWFGTNQLGVGLHAYGFNDTLAVGLVCFWVSQSVVIGMGLLPLHFWTSYSALTAAARPIEIAVPPDRANGKRRGKRGTRPGDTGYLSGPM